MDLAGIISISGRPGLYKVIAQGKNSVIVESVTDKKRFPAYATDRISALDDISIYTYDSDKPLKEVFADIYAKLDGKEAPSHKEDISVLQTFLLDILPDYDEDRVYASDIKKLFQWFNMLLKAGNLKPVEEKKAVAKKPAKAESEKADKTEKKPAAKKPASKAKAPAKKADDKKPAAKKETAAKKKPAAKK